MGTAGKSERRPEENKDGRVAVVFVESSLSNSTLSNTTVALVADKIG